MIGEEADGDGLSFLGRSPFGRWTQLHDLRRNALRRPSPHIAALTQAMTLGTRSASVTVSFRRTLNGRCWLACLECQLAQPIVASAVRVWNSVPVARLREPDATDQFAKAG